MKMKRIHIGNLILQKVEDKKINKKNCRKYWYSKTKH